MPKIVFIVITRSFLIRNILRSGVIGHLKQHGCRVVIFLQTLKGKDIPGYLREEFEDENVILEIIKQPLANNFFDRFYKIFVRWTSLLVYSDSTWGYSKAGNVNSRSRMWFWKYVEKFIFSILTKIHFIKGIVRWLEKSIFVPNFYAAYFDKYQPNIVFSTSIISEIDIAFMKEARKRGVKTVGMTKGWDHASRVLYRFIPNKILIQNFIMMDYLLKYQRIDRGIIKVCGFPQFDWYANRDLLVSREEFFFALGLDPKKKLIFFGSEGAWSPGDDTTVGILSDFINSDALSLPASMIIRPHFSDINTQRYDRFIKPGAIQIDNNINYQESLPSNWDPDEKEVKYFVNLLYYMDVLVNIASTLTLDACCFDKPIIAVGFGVLRNLRSGKDVTDVYYEMDHYQDVLKTGAVDLVKSEQELLDSLNRYLVHPEHKREERKILLNKLCFKVDGNSAKRIANEILSML